MWWERNFGIIETLFEDKFKQAIMGEIAYNETQGETCDLENSIPIGELELRNLERDYSIISQKLAKLQKGGGMSFWPKPIQHLDMPLCDAPNMIIIKTCGLCGQWYHYFDIVVTSCLHTYHPTCLNKHLKTNNKCKVCNQRLHPNWWCG
jgi:hypothetical protein